MRLIDAEALDVVTFTDRDGTFSDGVQWILEKIDNLPTIDERKKGKWIAYGDIPKTCPYCHEDWDKYVYGDIWYNDDLPNYCPNCGEEVRGEQE